MPGSTVIRCVKSGSAAGLGKREGVGWERDRKGETWVAQQYDNTGKRGGGLQHAWLHAVTVTRQLRSQGFPELTSVKRLLTERPFLCLALCSGKQCLWPTPWAFSSEAAMGAGVWDWGLPEASRFKPIPQTCGRIAYRELCYSQVPGYIFICAWDSHLFLKKKPHIC